MQSRPLIGSELPLVERLRKMQGVGDYQLAALMDGVGPQAADEIERLLAICTTVHDRLLRGDDDKELLGALEQAWKQTPND